MFVLDEIAAYLRSSGVGKVYEAVMPDQPDDCIALYEYAGVGPEFDHGGQAWENPRLQCVARADAYPNARAKAQEVYELLNGKANVTISGGNYLWIMALQSPFALGQDQNQRHRIVINFELRRRS